MSFVFSETGGLQSTMWQKGIGGSSERTSPIPWASFVPPVRQNGTSAPTERASAPSVSAERRVSYTWSSSRSTAAASVLPPASPAPTGMALCTATRTRAGIPVCSEKACTAFHTVLRPSRGTYGRFDQSSIFGPLPGRRVTTTLSARETLCMTEESRW